MTDEKMSLAVFDAPAAMVADLVKKNADQNFDHTTEAGEKDLKSWVFRLRGGKGDIEKARKATKADALAFGKKVDARAKELTVPLEKMITERMKPLDEIEAKKRAAAEAIVEAERIAEEKAEAERQADLKRREAVVAKKEAEIKEKERIEREKQIALDAAEKERKEAERVAVNRVKVAEQEKAQVIEKAEREKAEAIEAEKEKARQIERERIAKEMVAENARLEAEKVERKRVENKKHREGIEYCIQKQLDGFIKDITKTGHLMDALKAGRINNITINY